MVPDTPDNALMFRFTMTADRGLMDAARDFVAELASEEAQKVIPALTFAAHEIEESGLRSRLLIEVSWKALRNLRTGFEDNLPYRITLRRLR